MCIRDRFKCLYATVYGRISKFPCCVISKVVVLHKIGVQHHYLGNHTTTSISWSSTSFLSGMVCSRTSLTRLSMNGESDSEHVCVQRVDSSNTLYNLLMDWKNSSVTKMLFKCLYAIVYIRISKFPCCVISKVVVLHKIGEVEKWNAYSIAYRLSNNCTNKKLRYRRETTRQLRTYT